MSTPNQPPIVSTVVHQHVEDAVVLYDQRKTLTRAPHVALFHLRRADDRLAAHLDGLAVAGDQAWPFCDAALETGAPGAVFTAAVRVIETRDAGRWNTLIGAATSSEHRAAVMSALGWLDARQLQGLVVSLFSGDPVRRSVGIAGCALHRVDPGPARVQWLRDTNALVRARALRAIGELGLQDDAADSLTALGDDDPECRFWAAWSATLLGNRGAAVDALLRETGVHRRRAFRLALQAGEPSSGHSVLQHLASDPAQVRWVIEGSGIVGDPSYVPWLLGHMQQEATARLAAEAFSTMTGLDVLEGFETPRPRGYTDGPSDRADDEDVALDHDEGLPWPDVPKIEAWWQGNARRFQAGTRYFMGEPVNRPRCLDVLKSGYQRQRILAALYLCLLDPGTPLFNTSAPAWRQQRLLAQMS